MDPELLLALCILWLSSTGALGFFLFMWFNNEGEAFHPHSVEVDTRHNLFCVVSSETVCKTDFAVKSISAFVAPRGSSSAKIFSALVTIMSVAGVLGSFRWHAVDDATGTQALLSQIGFSALALVAACELDVVPAKFFEDKLLITSWLLEKLGADKELPFPLQPSNKEFRLFILHSPMLHHMFDEEITSHCQWQTRYGTEMSSIPFTLTMLWDCLHMVGAVLFVSFVPLAIILNDNAETKVAYITGITFLVFTFFGYLSGEYLPVLRIFRCWLLVWNPFIRDPHYMLKLRQAVDAYKTRLKELHTIDCSSTTVDCTSTPPRLRKTVLGTVTIAKDGIAVSSSVLGNLSSEKCEDESYYEALGKADAALDTRVLKYARRDPKGFIRIVGHVLVLSELVAMMTPVVAIGIQWATALCDGPPVLAIIDLIWVVSMSFFGPEKDWNGRVHAHEQVMRHCIIKH